MLSIDTPRCKPTALSLNLISSAPADQSQFRRKHQEIRAKVFVPVLR